MALTSQIVEWVRTGYDAQAAQQQNAVMLSEIRKAVTRLETIGRDFGVSLPINEPILKAYKDNLDKRLDVSERMSIGVGQVYKGIRVGTKHREDWRTIQAKAHGENDPATPKPRLSDRSAESSTQPSAVIFDSGIRS